MQSVIFVAKNTVRFQVWAPLRDRVTLRITAPFEKECPMLKDEWGTFAVELQTEHRDLSYYFRPDNEADYPDPASRFQPDGAHGPSRVLDHSAYAWNDRNWKSIPFEEWILYELHVGTFTPEGTFDAIIPRLDELKTLGINAIEIMPVAQFPGDRNWGYDGVFPYAVQNSYGGPDGLKRLVDTCHQKGIAVVLDVVYNHMGPEGNYLSKFGPYFTNAYRTLWGEAINFDGEWSDGVREYFAGNAVDWLEHFHIDALRCDAIHAIFDNGAVHLWELLAEKVKALEQRTGRTYYLIAESDLNSPRVVKPVDQGGFGFTAQWLDDFHHALYTWIDQEGKDRFADFQGIEQLAKAYTNGFVHGGDWVSFRKRRHGAPSAGLPGHRFIAFTTNHDQVGNRARGERLSVLVNFERLKLAAAALLLSPYIPMLFMGEEYGDQTPFYYFVSHSDPALVEAVREGRKNEFKNFALEQPPPDPQDPATFKGSKIDWDSRNSQKNATLWQWHKHLIALRKSNAALKNLDKKDIQAHPIGDAALALYRPALGGRGRLLILFNFSEETVRFTVPAEMNGATKMLDSMEAAWLAEDRDTGPLLPVALSGGTVLELLPESITAYAING